MKIGHGLVQLHPSPIEQHHIIGDLFQFSQQVAGYQHAPTIGSKPPDQATDPPDPRRIEALVGSSRIRTLGWPSTARANPRRCFIPRE